VGARRNQALTFYQWHIELKKIKKVGKYNIQLLEQFFFFF